MKEFLMNLKKMLCFITMLACIVTTAFSMEKNIQQSERQYVFDSPNGTKMEIIISDDAYAILGVAVNATQEEISQAYHARTEELKSAVALLNDPLKRNKFDAAQRKRVLANEAKDPFPYCTLLHIAPDAKGETVKDAARAVQQKLDRAFDDVGDEKSRKQYEALRLREAKAQALDKFWEVSRKGPRSPNADAMLGFIDKADFINIERMLSEGLYVDTILTNTSFGLCTALTYIAAMNLKQQVGNEKALQMIEMLIDRGASIVFINDKGYDFIDIIAHNSPDVDFIERAIEKCTLAALEHLQKIGEQIPVTSRTIWVGNKLSLITKIVQAKKGLKLTEKKEVKTDSNFGEKNYPIVSTEKKELNTDITSTVDKVEDKVLKFVKIIQRKSLDLIVAKENVRLEPCTYRRFVETHEVTYEHELPDRTIFKTTIPIPPTYYQLLGVNDKTDTGTIKEKLYAKKQEIDRAVTTLTDQKKRTSYDDGQRECRWLGDFDALYYYTLLDVRSDASEKVIRIHANKMRQKLIHISNILTHEDSRKKYDAEIDQQRSEAAAEADLRYQAALIRCIAHPIDEELVFEERDLEVLRRSMVPIEKCLKKNKGHFIFDCPDGRKLEIVVPLVHNGYALLGVMSDATLEEIGSAYRAKCEELRTAIAVLTDPEQRSEFDAVQKQRFREKLTEDPFPYCTLLHIPPDARKATIEDAAHRLQNKLEDAFLNLGDELLRKKYDSELLKKATPVAWYQYWDTLRKSSRSQNVHSMMEFLDKADLINIEKLLSDGMAVDTILTNNSYGLCTPLLYIAAMNLGKRLGYEKVLQMIALLIAKGANIAFINDQANDFIDIIAQTDVDFIKKTIEKIPHAALKQMHSKLLDIEGERTVWDVNKLNYLKKALEIEEEGLKKTEQKGDAQEKSTSSSGKVRHRFLLAPQCEQCSKKENLKTCDACKTVFYCSRECQKAGWRSHKGDCSKKK